MEEAFTFKAFGLLYEPVAAPPPPRELVAYIERPPSSAAADPLRTNRFGRDASISLVLLFSDGFPHPFPS